MIQDLEDGSRQAYSYCIDLKSGYTAGAFKASSTVDNFILDIISFGNGVYFAGYIDGYEIEVFIRDAEAQANNKEAFDIGYRTGRTAVVISYLAILAGGISSSGTAPGEMAITPEGYEVYINGSAAAQAGIGIIPGTLGSAKVGEGDSKPNYGDQLEVSDQKMYQQGQHYNKHGKDMGYGSKKDYEAGARNFIENNKSTADIFEVKWNFSRGGQSGETQIIIRADGKQAIINKETGQIIDFYEGTSLDGFINVRQVQ